jgi:hypothetical protein
LFYGCDDVAGVTYVRGGDIIDDYPPTLTSPQQLESPRHHPQHRSHQYRLRCHRRRLPNHPTYTTHTQSIRGGPEYHPRQNNMVLAEESTLRVVSRRQHKREHKREHIGSGGSARGSKRGSKMGAGAAQEGAKWVRRQHKREQRRADCWAFGSGVGVSCGFLLRRVFLWFCGVSGVGSTVR